MEYMRKVLPLFTVPFIFLFLVLSVCLCPSAAYAEQAPEIELKLNADKPVYQEGDTAHITLTATHKSGDEIHDVHYNVSLPESFDASEATLQGTIEDMKPGDTREVKVDVPVVAKTTSEEIVASADQSNSSESKDFATASRDGEGSFLAITRDNIGYVFAVIGALLIGGLVVCVRRAKTRKLPKHCRASIKPTSILSLALAVCLISLAGTVGSEIAFASEGPSSKTAKMTVQVKNSTYELSATLTWKTATDSSSDNSNENNDPIVYQDGVIVLQPEQAYDFVDEKFYGDTVSASIADDVDLKVGDIVVIRPNVQKNDYFGGAMEITSIDRSVSPNKIYGVVPDYNDVIKSTHINTSTTGIGYFTSASQPQTFALTTQAGGESDWSWNITEIEPGVLALEVHFSSDDKDVESGAEKSKELSVTGTIKPSADIVVEHNAPDFSRVSVINTSTVNVKISGSISHTENIFLGKGVLPTPVPGLAVECDMYLRLLVGGEVELDVKLAAKNGIDASADGVYPINEVDPSVAGSAKADLELALSPTLGARIGPFSIANMTFSIGPHVSVFAETRQDAPPALCIDSVAYPTFSYSLGNNIGDYRPGAANHREYTVLGRLAEYFHYELPGGEWLGANDENPFRVELGHFEDGEQVPECTAWDKYSRTPSWSEPNIASFNRLAAPFVVDEGNSFSIGDKDADGYIVGGIGLDVEYQLWGYNVEMSRDCVVRITQYDSDGQIVSQQIKSRDNQSYRKGSENYSARKNYREKTMVEVLKGKVLIKSILAPQIPVYSMGTCETVRSFYDAAEALKDESDLAASRSNVAMGSQSESGMIDSEERETNIATDDKGEDGLEMTIAESGQEQRINDVTGLTQNDIKSETSDDALISLDLNQQSKMISRVYGNQESALEDSQAVIEAA